MTLFNTLAESISTLEVDTLSPERKQRLAPFVAYLRHKMAQNEPIRLNFICTHNSRRSHLAQVWAQTLAYYVGFHRVTCYSAGTEKTAVFPHIIATLRHAGFQIYQLSEGGNPVYSVKFEQNEHPITLFSKSLSHSFNPSAGFAAVMTCAEADEGCPFVPGAEQRFSLPFEDPKRYDNSPLQAEKYTERSIQIATELLYVFQNAI